MIGSGFRGRYITKSMTQYSMYHQCSGGGRGVTLGLKSGLVEEIIITLFSHFSCICSLLFWFYCFISCFVLLNLILDLCMYASIYGHRQLECSISISILSLFFLLIFIFSTPYVHVYVFAFPMYHV